MARVDEETEDDQDILVWDRNLGWLVDVHIVGGPMDGEGPINCRLASFAQGNDVIEANPPRSGAFVVVLIPNGDPNDDCVIVGQLTSDDEPAPMMVNGDTIVERNASSGEVAAIETHITVAPDEDLDQEWRNVRINAQTNNLIGENVSLGIIDADQSFARGDDLADALDDLSEALNTFVTTLTSSTPTPIEGALSHAVVVSAATPLIVSIQAFQAARNLYLSTRIKGD